MTILFLRWQVVLNSKEKNFSSQIFENKEFWSAIFLTQGSFFGSELLFLYTKTRIISYFPFVRFFFPLMFWARMGIITFYFLPISTFRFKNRFKRFLWRLTRGPKGFRSRVFSTRQLSWSSTSCGRRKRQPPSTGTLTTSRGNKRVIIYHQMKKAHKIITRFVI